MRQPRRAASIECSSRKIQPPSFGVFFVSFAGFEQQF